MPSNAFSCVGVMLSKERRKTAPHGVAWWPGESVGILHVGPARCRVVWWPHTGVSLALETAVWLKLKCFCGVKLVCTRQIHENK